MAEDLPDFAGEESVEESSDENFDESSWMVRFVNVPPDGSCFYWGVACALEASRQTWCESLAERVALLQYRYQLDDERRRMYAEGACFDVVPVTMQLMRLVTAEHLTDDDLVQQNMLAEMENFKVYETLDEFKEAVRTRQWANFTCIRALLRALDHQIGLVIFDKLLDAGVVCLPPEWMRERPHYVMLRREREHYDIVEISRTVDGCREAYILPPHALLAEALGENAEKFNIV